MNELPYNNAWNRFIANNSGLQHMIPTLEARRDMAWADLGLLASFGD